MTVEIRPFREEDLGSVLELANSHASFDGRTSEADLAITTSFPRGFWVAEANGELVGFAYGYLKDVPEEVLARWRATKVGYVALMAVAPSHRGGGIGGSLLAKVLEELKIAGADMVLLDCPAEAADAKRLYEAKGFEARFYGMKRRL